MIYTPMTKKALKLCFEAHKEQLDKSGMPYVFHPFTLASAMDDEISVTAALLHDVAEDTDVTLEDMRNMGFNERVIEVLALLTHADEVPYTDYIAKIKTDETAKKVKLADLRHNSDLSRLDEITPEALERQKKYLKAIEFLESE